jgi:hypothetical protein
LVAWPQPGQACTAGAAAAWPVTCAPHIEQNGVFALTGVPQLGQLAGALAGAGCAVAAFNGVPQCIQNGELLLMSPPQCEQRVMPVATGPLVVGAPCIWGYSVGWGAPTWLPQFGQNF